MKTKNAYFKGFLLAFFAILNIFYVVNSYALIKIVAAENMYGEVAKELGGNYVTVTSILQNPAQDPHFFSMTPSVAKALNHADIIIYNGAGYDTWIQPLITTNQQAHQYILDVAALLNIKSGENPHLWYSPNVMPVVAKTLSEKMSAIDPQHKDYFAQQLIQFNKHYQIIFEKINQIKNQFANTPVIATEPIFGYMAKALNLKMYSEDFQRSMMNDISPSISQIKNFENKLYQHQVKLLIYNQQVSNPLTERMRKIAEQQSIPILGVSEMMSFNMTYIEWIMQTLNELEKKLQPIKEKKNP